MRRIGPRRQRPGTFRRLDNDVEYWQSFCPLCDTTQDVIDHIMVRHDTRGEPYDESNTLATRRDPRNPDRTLDRGNDWIQPELALDPPPEDDTPIPF